MRAIMETGFDLVYLTAVIAMGIWMVRASRGREQVKLFGVMALVLGCGDAFHLLPRAYALCTDGLYAHAAALGAGKLITSITMTAFYVLLYEIARRRYHLKSKPLTGAVYALAAARIALCCCPGNEWLSPAAPLSWGIARNLPFAALGIVIIVLFFVETRKTGDRPLRFLWLAVTLSFGFYLPVVLWADRVPAVGALMIPKTCAYVWIVWMGFQMARAGTKKSIDKI